MTAEREPHLWTLLRNIGCRFRKADEYFVLDGFDGEFYLKFDVAIDADNSKPNTCDIHVKPTGSHPKDSEFGMRVLRDAREMHVIRFLFALGVQRFSEKTRKALYERNMPIRTLKSGKEST